MANAPVLKTGGRKPLGVRVPRPPSLRRVLMSAAPLLAACASRTASSDIPKGCPADTTVYAFADTARGVIPPILVQIRPTRPGLGEVTVEGIVDRRGRIERGSVTSSGGGPGDDRWAASDALFWSEFAPARLDGCPVRFRYRVRFVGGIPRAEGGR